MVVVLGGGGGNLLRYCVCNWLTGLQEHPLGYSGVVRDRLKHHLSSVVSIEKWIRLYFTKKYYFTSCNVLQTILKTLNSQFMQSWLSRSFVIRTEYVKWQWDLSFKEKNCLSWKKKKWYKDQPGWIVRFVSLFIDVHAHIRQSKGIYEKGISFVGRYLALFLCHQIKLFE